MKQILEPSSALDCGGFHFTNLTAARDAREREIILQAMQDCRTIRQLTEYLQTSPATVLRKLKNNGLNL
jgi:DNA-binding NtrC family response regulator